MSTPDTTRAGSFLYAAIKLHMKHMNGTAPTTGKDGEKSQQEMMDMMQSAYKALTGSVVKGAGM